MEKEIDEIKESSSWAPRERREINIHSGEISNQSPSDKNLLLDLKRRKLEAFSEELTMMQTTATSKKGIRSQDLNASFPNEGNTNTLSSRFVYDTPQKNIRRDWPKAPMTAPGHKNRAHSYISAGVQGTRKIYTSSGKKDPPNYPYNISNNNSGVFSIPQQTGMGKMRITSQRGSMDTSLNAKLQDTLQREREISMRGNIEFMQRENIELVKKHRLKEDELKQKISLLQGKVEHYASVIGKMKNINRDLLLNNSGKNLFMEDADREMEEMYSQLQEARDENKLGSRQMGKLRAENENIKVVVNRYRKMATQLNTEIRNLKEKGTWRNTGLNSPFPGVSPNNKDKADVASEQDSSTFGISPFRVIADNMSEMSQDISPSPTHTHRSKKVVGIRDVVSFEMFLNTMKKANKIDTIKDLIELIYADVPIFMKCNKVGIFLFDPRIRKLFQKEEGISQIIIIEKEIVEIANPESREIKITPGFKNMSQIRSGLKRPQLLLKALLSKETELTVTRSTVQKILLCIQIEGKTRGIVRGETMRGGLQSRTPAAPTFSIQDELMFSVFCAHIANTVERLLGKYTVDSMVHLNQTIMDTCADICGDTNKCNIVEIVQERLPDAFGFEKAALLYYTSKQTKDSKQPSQYIYSIVSSTKTEMPGADIIRYPKGLGITGKAISSGKITYSNMGKNDILYNTETDNVPGVKIVENILCVPLFGGFGEFVGIFQLYNKKEGDINQHDVEYMIRIQKILGKTVANAEGFNFVLKILSSVHQNMDSADRLLQEGEQDSKTEQCSIGGELNSKLVDISKLVSDLVVSKKNQFFWGTGLYYSTK